MLVTSIFSFFHDVFYRSYLKFQFLRPIFFCRLQMLSILTSLKFCRFGNELISFSLIFLSISLCPWSCGRAQIIRSRVRFPAADINFGIIIRPPPPSQFRCGYWGSSDYAELREIVISCKNLYLNRFKSKYV